MKNPIRTNYENKQMELIKDWEHQVSEVVSKGMGLLAKPTAWHVQKDVPSTCN